SVGPAQRDLDRLSHERGNQFTFVVSRSAHVGMGVGCSSGCFGGGGNDFVVNTLSAENCLSFAGADRSEADTAQRDCGVLAEVAFHRKLHCGAGGRVNGGRPLECYVSAAT